MSNSENGLAAAMERGRLCCTLSIVAVILSAVFCGIVFFTDTIFQWSGLPVFTYSIYPFFFALIFSAAALARGGFYAKMLREEEEKILLERRKENVASILDVSEDVRFSAKRILTNFDKYLPSTLALLSFLIGGLLLYLFQQTPDAAGEMTEDLLQLNVPANPVNLAFLSIVCAAFSFFTGIFLTGQSRIREFRWLRPVGGMMILGGLVMFLCAAGALLYVYGKTGVEPYLAKGVFALECVLTVEFLISFIIEFYRPRSNDEVRPVYESRVLTIFTEPGGVMRNVAESLDYQFGFKVSKTSVYLFLRKIFVPALMIWAFLLWIFTSLGEVAPGELGIRERFGAAVGEDLGPGIHWKLPWPIERIVRVPVDQVQVVRVGAKPDEDPHVDPVVLWAGDHSSGEDPFLVAAKDNGNGKDISYSVAILETSLPIYYKAKRSEIRNYAFQFEDIPSTLRAIGKAEATAYFASTDFLADISYAREDVCRDLKDRIQKQCDTLKMGIEIVSVNMTDAHPPIGKPKNKDDAKSIDTNVAEAFQMIVIAQEAAKSLESGAYSSKAAIDGTAQVEAARILAEAQTYRNRTVEHAKAETDLFQARVKAFRSQPEIFALRTYLNFLTQDCKDQRKFIVSKELLSRIYEFDFKEKTKVDLMNDPDFKKLGESD